ncbi:MAG TPA: DNA-processing protein DprA [Gemmatimonadaceae bacterium]|nr:DNA-processing protein DprA [Gemmatimonadaceae bacterium]
MAPGAARAGVALSLAPGVGRVRFRALLDECGEHEAAFTRAVPESRRDALLHEAALLIERAEGCESQVAVYGLPSYPSRLRDLPDPPPVLYLDGHAAWLGEGPVVGMVGTRAATSYGERVTGEIAGQLARAGALVVSGMARGIDAAAHRGALGAGGRSGAVLGTGIDIAYPASHRSLHAELRERGVVATEVPPGEKATGGSFPERNRIIAALSDLVIVIEAGRKSGALITASRALELGRAVAAVPGPIDSPQSAGSNELLRDGAQLIASAADALALVGLTAPPRAPATDASGVERVVWDALSRGALDLDALASRTALPARVLMAAVTRLELSGAVECALTGEVRRR